MNYQQFVVFIEFDKIDKETEKSIIDELHNKQNVSWIGVLSGKWSLTFDVFAKNNEEFNQFMTSILNKFESNVGDYRVLTLQESRYFFNKIIGEENTAPKLKDHHKKIEKKVDQTDKKILSLLNEDARVSYATLSEKLKLTPNAIKSRIQNLQKGNLILSYSISINHKTFGLEWQGIQIKLTKPSIAIENKLKAFLGADKRVIFYYHYNKIGIYDFDVGVVVNDSEELREFVNKLRREFYEEIKIENSFLVLEEVSSHNLPPVIFK